ncbi:hypothetical protein [Gynuella sunshinyii]|uniref:Gp5/Type VI secretion system Vgr protein OB-fold domain-containing protein n=1 Tax=Gynuella sunshinyii YC6258 TaxID=1445510 RepID=A0A0C5VFD7_9GAMM|nr:hypothetical protein [Gynuella sunshinyii]AJQ97985.1 hypothetical Protein YC6258_05961 [Gynuella sunshinyii YC6258]
MSLVLQSQSSSPTHFTARVRRINTDAIELTYQQQIMTVPLTHCSAAILGLQTDDQVMVEQQGDSYFVLHRLLRQGEHPLPLQYDAQGRLTISAGKSLRLHTPKGEILIDSQGCLSLQGQDIHAEAEHSHTIQGQTVKLN